jgi:hypothetical protein
MCLHCGSVVREKNCIGYIYIYIYTHTHIVVAILALTGYISSALKQSLWTESEESLLRFQLPSEDWWYLK